MKLNRILYFIVILSSLQACKDESHVNPKESNAVEPSRELHMTDHWIPKSALFVSEDRDSLQIVREEFTTPKTESIFAFVIMRNGKRFEEFKYKITDNKLYQYVAADSTLYFRYDFNRLSEEIKPTHSMIGMGMMQLALDTKIAKGPDYYFKFFSNFHFYTGNEDLLLETVRKRYPIDYLVFDKRGRLKKVRLYENKKWYFLED